MSARLQRGAPDPSGFHPRILPPVWAALVAAGMYGVDLALARGDAPRLEGSWSTPAGLALLLLGVALSAWASWQFVSDGTPIEPGREPTTLLTSGPYRYSRNPIYVGMAIGLAGWAFWLAQPLALTGPALFLAIIWWRIVRFEERTLAARFGADYDAYRARVRRWL